MQTKNQKRQKLLEKFEEEFAQLREERELEIISREHEQHLGYFRPTARYLYVESQINALKKNMKKEK